MRKKGKLSKNKQFHRSRKTKLYKRDIDQIYEDQDNKIKLENQDIDESLPGFGQFYCVNCARYFVTKNSLEAHIKTKFHKRFLKN